MEAVSRRRFVVALAASGGGLLVGFRLDGGQSLAAASESETASRAEFVANAFVRIGSDGRITLMMSQVEMGQGTYTALPMLIAEELEIGLDQVELEAAPPNDTLYANPMVGFQMTGASSSVRRMFQPVREAGAAARTMLVAAAAQTWGVEPRSCRAEKGAVTHLPTGRRLAYGALADRAATLPVPDHVVLKDPKDFRLIGTPAKRLDLRAKVNGTAQYGIDVRVPGMKIATVAASPVLGGTLVGLDERKALAVSGVRQVVRLEDCVAVVADHLWAARQGLAALEVRWDDGANAGVSTADVVRGLDEATRQPGVIARREGDTEAAMAAAASRIEAHYQVPFLAHAAMEPANCTVHVRPDACEVWTGSQVLTRVRAKAAEVTGLPVDKVVVHNQLLGSSFGRRLEVDIETQAVRIASHVAGPVKVVWTREEDLRHDVYRPYYYDRIAAGLDAQGKPVAWTHRLAGPSILARWAPPAFKDGIDGDAVDAAVQLLYDIPAIRVEYVRHEEPVLKTGFWRGVGPTHNCFVIESFIDELAAAAGQDPLAFRQRLLGKAPRAQAVLELAAEKSGWGRPLPGAGWGRGVSLLYSEWGSYLAEVAEVDASENGRLRVHRVVCAVDCGTIVNPEIVKAQIEGGVLFGISAALWGQVTVKQGRVEQSNFHDYRVLRMSEAPAVEVHLVRNREAPGGIGEPATAVTAPAVANALFAATGRRVRQLPLVR